MSHSGSLTNRFRRPALPLHDTETAFASQGIAGIRWMAGRHIAVDLDSLCRDDPTFNVSGASYGYIARDAGSAAGRPEYSSSSSTGTRT